LVLQPCPVAVCSWERRAAARGSGLEDALARRFEALEDLVAPVGLDHELLEALQVFLRHVAVIVLRGAFDGL
jgi:hypothetical protein